jgi:AcrR family transcriptional regulator
MAKIRGDLAKNDYIGAAEKLILEKGANDFSLAELAKEMGISKGTLYYHYPTKDQLILDIIEEHMSQLSQEYEAWLLRHQKDIISEGRFLDVILYKGIKLFNRCKMHIYLINECMRGNEAIRSQYVSLWGKWEKKLEEGLATSFPQVKDREGFAYMLMLIIDGLAVQEALANPNEAMVERMKAILIEKENAQ